MISLGVGDRVCAVACGLLIRDIVSLSGDIGGIFPGDDASFSQTVEPVEGGNPSTAQSRLSLTRYSIAIGRAGVAGGRGIDNCVDCDSDKLSFPSGSFWRVGIDLSAPDPGPD